jgi:hypothetical protein
VARSDPKFNGGHGSPTGGNVTGVWYVEGREASARLFCLLRVNASPTDRVPMCRISHLASVMMSDCVRSALLRRVALMMAHS